VTKPLTVTFSQGSSFGDGKQRVRGHLNNMWHSWAYFRPPLPCFIWWHWWNPPGTSPGVTWHFDFKQNLFLNSKFSFQKQNAIRNTKLWLKNGKMSRYTLSNPLPPPLFVIWWHCPDPPRVSRIIWMAPNQNLRLHWILSQRLIGCLLIGYNQKGPKTEDANKYW
jgi:hypothetical protein